MNITGQIDTPAGVLKHPANDSSSKFQWTFSKSARFPQPKTYTSTISYDLPSTASRRKSGMGFGNRSTIFDGLKDKPDPTRYTISSTFKDKRSGRGHSFGSSRDNIKFANYLKQSEDTPGPYDINDKQTKSTRAYSLRPRTAYPKNCTLLPIKIFCTAMKSNKESRTFLGQPIMKQSIWWAVEKISITLSSRHRSKNHLTEAVALAEVNFERYRKDNSWPIWLLQQDYRTWWKVLIVNDEELWEKADLKLEKIVEACQKQGYSWPRGVLKT